jgi:DNA-binding GntR family transcriptional regulator
VPRQIPVPSAQPSRLQRDIAARILDLARRGEILPGERLNEVAIARALRVSRTPVRGALAHLASEGVVERGRAPGFRLREGADLSRGPAPAAGEGTDDEAEDRMMLAIARDRVAGLLGDTVSEADLMRAYAAPRARVGRVLSRLAEMGVAERNPGYGWRLEAPDAEALRESYRFRLVVEPAGLLEPGFRLDPAWTAEMRARHRSAIEAPWREEASIAFFEMNAEFHEGLAAASGNRFLQLAVARHNRLRRFHNYDWRHGHGRVVVSSREHLEILDRAEEGEAMVASVLLRRHIERASLLPD